MLGVDRAPSSRLTAVREDIGKAHMDLKYLKSTITDKMKERQLQSYPRVDLRTSHSLWLGSHRTRVPSEDIIQVLGNDNNAVLTADICFQIIVSWVVSFVVVSYMRQSSVPNVQQLVMEFQPESFEMDPNTQMEFDNAQSGSNYVHTFANPSSDEADIQGNSNPRETNVIYENQYDSPELPPTLPSHSHTWRRKKGGRRKQKFE